MTLVERIEALEGPDREIDAEIAMETGWKHRSGCPYRKVVEWERPRYTASIDAAMTLLGYSSGRPHNLCIASAYGSAYIVPNDGESYGINDPAKGQGRAQGDDEIGRVARAICAAALRAKEQG